MHSLAHTEPIYDFYFMRASRDSDKQLETYCGRCHTPLAVFDRQIPFAHPLRKAGDTRVGPLAAEGVQCDFCHTITGHTRVANSGFVVRASDRKGGPLADARPVSHRARHAPYFRSAELCGTCHQVVHPTNGIKLETTYSEWKASPYAAAGVVCQDCHMTAGLEPKPRQPVGTPRRHPGQAARQGRQRAHVSQHYFVGPNLVFAPAGSPLRKLSEQLLQRAGRVELGPVRRDSKQRLSLQLRVTNTGAGHYLPTGVTELRELWLEVTVRDATGRLLLHSGALDQQGNIRPGAVVYRTSVLDAKGRDTTLFWNTVRKASDRRIPPLTTLTERYSAPVSPGVTRVTVEAALHYRSVSPAGLAEAGVPPGTVNVPVFTISRAKKVVSL